MIYTKDHKTVNIFDPFNYLGPKRKSLIENSWAKIFRDEILPELPVHKLQPFYHSSRGAPTKELYAMLGLMILQQMHDFTDEEAVDEYAFNIKWHYAMNITSDSDRDTYISPKTLWMMRDILTKNDLYTDVFDSVTEKLARLLKVDTTLQRYDSRHIYSNMRHLGRIRLFVATIKKFLVNLKRHHGELFDGLEKEQVDRYISKKGESLFSMVKPSESEKTLESLSEDLFFLIERFKGKNEVASMSSYKLLARLMKEQCIVEDDITTKGKKISVKPNKEVPSDSLQNPSDPDAGYSGHKGKGYQVQVAETYSNNKEDNSISLITHVQVESADKSDANALIPLIDATQDKGLGPEEVLADSLYGGDENCEKAKELGVEVISPVMGRSSNKEINLGNFDLSEDGTVKNCPEGKEPVKTGKKKNRYTATFDIQCCKECDRVRVCLVKSGKRGYYLRYKEKDVRVAKRRIHEQTPEFQDKYRYRAGVEATMSYYDRKTGVKRLRVRGLKAVSFSATLKAIGVNLFRAAAFKNNESGYKDSLKQVVPAFIDRIYNLKEQFLSAAMKIRKISGSSLTNYRFEMKLAV
ncbi:MAG TPA: hypothetical protein ENH40_05210 [Nitrospirae bacterium]|nr:hypothetical protein [Nitrospirota bacterium]